MSYLWHFDGISRNKLIFAFDLKEVAIFAEFEEIGLDLFGSLLDQTIRVLFQFLLNRLHALHLTKIIGFVFFMLKIEIPG